MPSSCSWSLCTNRIIRQAVTVVTTADRVTQTQFFNLHKMHQAWVHLVCYRQSACPVLVGLGFYSLGLGPVVRKMQHKSLSSLCHRHSRRSGWTLVLDVSVSMASQLRLTINSLRAWLIIRIFNTATLGCTVRMKQVMNPKSQQRDI